MMRYFSADTGQGELAATPPHLERVAVPVGDICLVCRKMIFPTDHGYMILTDTIPFHEDGFVERPYHAACLQRMLKS